MARRPRCSGLALVALALALLTPSTAGGNHRDLLGQWHLDQVGPPTLKKAKRNHPVRPAGGPPPETPDSSGHGLNAQSGSPGVPQPIPGRFQNGMLFAQDTSLPQSRFFQIDDTPILSPAGQITVLAWIKRQQNTAPSFREWIFGKGSMCSQVGGSWGLYNDVPAPGQGVKFFVSTDGTTTKETPRATNVLNGEWHALAGTYDGSRVRLYVDGSQVGTGTAASGTIKYGLEENNDVWFGQNEASCADAQQWEGGIDEVRVYNRALSAAEIEYLHRSSHTTPPNLPIPPPGAPQVTELKQVPSGGAGGSSASGAEAKVSGNVTGLQWTIGGTRIDTLPGQTAIRFLALKNTPIKVRAIGPGGAGPFKSLIVKPPPLPTGKTAGKVIKKIGKAKVIGAGPPGKCASNVQAGNLDIQGCLRPITSLAGFPAAERGILQQLGRHFDIPTTDGALGTAVKLTTPYLASGAVTVNGVKLTPGRGAAIVVYPHINGIASSNAKMAIGGINLASPAKFLLDTAASKNGVIPLGTFKTLASSSLKSLGGLFLSGDVDVSFPKPFKTLRGAAPGREALVKISLRIPFLTTGLGTSKKSQVTLRASNKDGLKVDNLKLGPLGGQLGPLAMKDFQLTYARNLAEWRGQGKACAVGQTCLDMIPPNGGVTVRNGALTFAGATLFFPPPGVPLFAGVNMQRIGFGVGLNPTRITGNTRVTALKIYEIDGRLLLAFPSSRSPYRLNAGEIPGFPGQFYGQSFTRTTLGVTANASLKVPVAGSIPLGNGYLLYEYPGYVAFGGGVDRSFFAVVSMRGGVNGEFNLRSGRFNVIGSTNVCLIKVLCRGGTALVSSRGLSGCLHVGPVNIGGGATFSPFRVSVWPLDGCKWSPFAEKNIRAAALEPGNPHTVKIKANSRSRAIELLGKTAAPRVRVTGPGGQSLESTPGSGFASEGALRIIRQEDPKLTVIGLQDAQPGTYTIAALPGSPAIDKVSEATDPPDAKVEATVLGSGAKRVLSYDILKRRAQRVTFTEVDGKARKQIGTVKGGGKGRLKFTPAPGLKPRKVEAQFELAGMPAETRTVTTFSPVSPSLGKVKGLRVRRKGTTLTISWNGVAGAKRYAVVADTTTVQRTLSTKRRSVKLRNIAKSSSGRVSVRAIASLREGGVASKKLKAAGKRKTRFKKLPKAPGL